MTHERLIAALEAATEGSRELDAEVAVACGWRSKLGDDGRSYWKRDDYDSWLAISDGGPDFYPTTSIDDALTLVPEGCIWKVFSDYPGDAYFADLEKWVPGHEGTEHWRTDGACSSPALALCIAALKARTA